MGDNFSSTFRGFWRLLSALLSITFLAATFAATAHAQDYQDQNNSDDPPSRVARLGYIEGPVSFQPAGEDEWVEAVPNRPMTTGDKLWADRNSRAELQLGSATIDLAPNTGFSFLNLDDNTVQIELTSGSLNVRVRELDRNDVFEIDTPNQAFTVYQPGRYRVEASDDGSYSVVTIREGEGESTGNGQSYTLHAGQRTTFSGTNSLNAEVQQIGNPDDFDNWSYARYNRYDNSRSSQYCSRDVVGYQDLDDDGDWQAEAEYGHVWYPRVAVGWAPYHNGHWAWIDPWGWTWVDDARWGYAPFHYGRWISVRGRWGWIPGPREVHPVYAPALVVFVGGGPASIGGNVAWFPLGPREVYVPSYRVSRGYVDRVNVSNTTVNVTQVTKVYNTTIINKTTNITNVTYVNRNVRGAVTAVPQRSFASAQPVARAAVVVNERQLAAAPVTARAAVPPVRAAVLGVHANTANRVAAPPRAIAQRQVIAKAAPPPPAASFAAREHVLAKNPGQPVPRQEMQKLRPANAPAAVMVKRAPPAKPATATPAPANADSQPGRPGNPAANRQPANPAPGAHPDKNGSNDTARPNQPSRQPNQPAPNNRPDANRPEPNRPQPDQPASNRPDNSRPDNNRAQPNRPDANRPTPKPENDRPSDQPRNQPAPNNRPPENRPDNNRPDNNARPEPNRPNNDHPNSDRPNGNPADNARPQPNRTEPPARNDRPSAQPSNRPDNRPDNKRPEPNQPQPNNPDAKRPQPNLPKDQPRNQTAPRTANPQVNRPANDRPNSVRPNNAQPDNARPTNSRTQPNNPADQAKPSPAQPRPNARQQAQKPKTAEEQKREEEQRKKEERPQ